MGWKDDYERRKEQKSANQKINNNVDYFSKKGVSTGTPSVSNSGITNTLPTAKTNTTVGPQEWNKNATITTLPKATQQTTTKKTSLLDRINQANENASKAYAKTAPEMQTVKNNRLDYAAASSIGKTLAGGATLAGAAKQSMSDWRAKVKSQGMRSALDDYTYNLDNPQYTYGTGLSKNNLGYRLYQEAETNQKKAKEGLPKALQTATDIGIGLGSMALTLPLAGLNPTLPTAVMAMNTAGNKTYELTKQGKTATEALGRGLVSGTLDYAAKKIGYEDFFNLAKNGTQGELMSALNSLDSNAKNAIIFGLKDIGYKYYSPSTLGALTWDAVRSGLAGAARTLADSAADTTYDKDAKINWEEVAKNGLTDALFSVLNNGAGYIGNRIKSSARGNTTENATSGTALPTAVNKFNEYMPTTKPSILPKVSQYSSNILSTAINDILPMAEESKQNIKNKRPTKATYDINKVKAMPDADNNDIISFVQNGISDKNDGQYLKLSTVSKRLTDDLKGIGLVIDGFVHALKDNNIRHINKSHGEKSSDKYKVGVDEYLLLNDIYENYDNLYKGYDTKDGQTTIAYEKRYNNKIYVVEEVFEEGVLAPKQIIVTGAKSKPSFLKKFTKISGKSDTDVSEYKFRSTDLNSPPGKHVRNADLSANTNILESIEKINTNSEENTAILPTAAQSDLSPITISDNNNVLPTAKEVVKNKGNRNARRIAERTAKFNGQSENNVDNNNVLPKAQPQQSDVLPTANDERSVDVNYSDYTENEIKEAMSDFTPHEQGIITSHINESGRTLPMAKGNNSSSVMKFTLRTDGEKKLIEKYNARLAKTKERYKNKISDIKVKHAEKVSKLKDDNKDKIKTLKAENKEKLDRQDLAARMAVGRAKAETQRKYENKISDIKVKHAEANEIAAKKREMSKLSDKVLKNTRKLNSKIKYMPPEMQEKVRNTIKNIDTKAKSISGKSIKEAIEVKAYVELMQSKDPDFVVSKDLQEKIDRLNKIRVSDMSYGDLKELDDTLKGLQHEFATYNKILGTAQHEFAKDMSAKAQVEVREAKARKNNFFNKIYDVESLNMSTVFNLLGNFNDEGAMAQLRSEFIDGQRKATKYVKEATQLFDEFLNNSEYSKELKSWGGKKAKRIDTGLVDNKGEKIYMTPGERIDIYLNSLNENNKASMENAGYTFMNLNALRKNDYKNLYRDVQPVILKPEDIKRIVGGMTEAEKEFAKIAFKYFNTMSTNAINEVSMITHGYERAQEKNYYPKAVDKDTIVTEFNLNKTEGNINNAGFLKERTGTTGVAIKGRNAVDVVIDAINDVSKLVGYGVPMRDFSMIWNTKNDSGTTLKKAVLDTYGNDMIDYVNKFVKDLNSVGSDNYFIDVFAGKLMSNYAASVLSANPKVSLQQTASIVTAAPEVGGANIIKGLFGTSPKLRKSILSQIDKRTGYRWDRAYRGNSTAELNALNTGGFKAVSKYQNVKDFANPMKWIRNMDLWATDEIACAAYFNILNKNKYEAGSEDFWNAVTHLYETTLENTQPMYNIMQRTGISRSKSSVAKAFNMFATQRNQNYNMMYSAFKAYKASKGKNSRKKEAKKLRSTIISLATANAIVVAITTLAQAITNDKRLRDANGNITVNSVADYYKRGYAEAAVGNFYLGTQIYNMFNSIVNGDTYYGTEEVTLDMINDIAETSIDLAEKLTEYIQGAAEARQNGVLPAYKDKEKSKAFKAAHDFAISVSKIAGVPLSNAEKYAMGIIGFISPELKAEYEAIYKDMTNANIKNASGKQQDEYLKLALEERVGKVDERTVKEIQNVYKSTEDSKVLPKYEAPETISQSATKEFKQIKHEMSAKDKNVYMKTYSKILKEEMPELVESSYWKGLSDDEKIAALSFMYNYAERQASKKVVKEYRISDDYNKNDLTTKDYKNYIDKKNESASKKKQGVIE